MLSNTISRVALALVLAAGAAGAGTAAAQSAPAGRQSAVDARARYRDPMGRTADTVLVRRGSKLQAHFVVPGFNRLPLEQQRAQARSVGRSLWEQVGRPEQVDTVKVIFTNQREENLEKVDRVFYFYRFMLEREPGS